MFNSIKNNVKILYGKKIYTANLFMDFDRRLIQFKNFLDEELLLEDAQSNANNNMPIDLRVILDNNKWRIVFSENFECFMGRYYSQKNNYKLFFVEVWDKLNRFKKNDESYPFVKFLANGKTKVTVGENTMVIAQESWLNLYLKELIKLGVDPRNAQFSFDGKLFSVMMNENEDNFWFEVFSGKAPEAPPPKSQTYFCE